MKDYHKSDDKDSMLVRDDSAHWYVIFEDMEEEFEAWVAYYASDDAYLSGQAWQGFNFDICRIDHPNRVRFKKWRVL